MMYESEKLGPIGELELSNSVYYRLAESKKYRNLKAKITVTHFGGSQVKLLSERKMGLQEEGE